MSDRTCGMYANAETFRSSMRMTMLGFVTASAASAPTAQPAVAPTPATPNPRSTVRRSSLAAVMTKTSSLVLRYADREATLWFADSSVEGPSILTRIFVRATDDADARVTALIDLTRLREPAGGPSRADLQRSAVDRGRRPPVVADRASRQAGHDPGPPRHDDHGVGERDARE